MHKEQEGLTENLRDTDRLSLPNSGISSLTHWEGLRTLEGMRGDLKYYVTLIRETNTTVLLSASPKDLFRNDRTLCCPECKACGVG